MNFEHPVLSSLLPVVFLISMGFVAGRAKLVRQDAVRDLTNLVFLVLAQALLFRTMSSVHLETLDLRPVFQYFVVASALFFIMLMMYGRDSRASVLALASIFSNTLMIGVPLVGLAYGEPGQVLLFTLISLHALVLLTMATVVLELQMAYEHAAEHGESRHMLKTVGMAMKNAVLHPVPLPILIGLIYAQTGWGLHPIVDKPLQLLGASFGPVALVLVGITLAQTPVGENFKGAMKISVVKTFVHPMLMAAAGYAMGMRGLHLTVMVVAAALPIGANVFLFSQRYQKEEDVVTAAVAVSTALALVSVTLVMALLPMLPA
ncbi:AEC family transporter [Limnohabitans sp. 103DPR2]|jgi:malonate transporter|uniref:AEC family transporter n=1 Tax=Limnohabitans sp. 103DPR2 TaxID=1678129 RepID=UPI0006DC8520|nr:AEC family transporter [Limnohabitans sp. 103DPR2]ALK91702.1 putative transporter YfdV [Limnohabitans sp. 103DPR2]MBU3721404.1 AEC family transporter [Limnohabitans sp.]